MAYKMNKLITKFRKVWHKNVLDLNAFFKHQYSTELSISDTFLLQSKNSESELCTFYMVTISLQGLGVL